VAQQIIEFNNDTAPVKMEVMQILNVARHWHDCLEVIWVVDGELNVSESNILFQLRTGDVYVANYNEPHKLFATNEAATVAILYIDQNHYKEDIKNLDVISFSHYCFSSNFEVKESLKNIRKLLVNLYKILNESHAPARSQSKIKPLMHSLLLLLVDTFKYIYFKKTDNGYTEMLDKSMGLTKEQIDRIHRLTCYIYFNSAGKLTLDDLAKSENYSRFYVSHFLKKAYGLSYQETLALARISCSERLLLGTDKSMEEIAGEVGFSNRSHFSQHFKKWHGVTPAQFRKENSHGAPGTMNIVFPLDDVEIDLLLQKSLLVNAK
jgi:AraC-like DNA-binding protein